MPMESKWGESGVLTGIAIGGTDQQHRLPIASGGLELSKEDHQVLSLRNRGFWPSEIAAVRRIEIHSVTYRLGRLRFSFPPRTGPRPNFHRKVTDEKVLSLARADLSIPEIAARLRISVQTAHKRIKHLTTGE